MIRARSRQLALAGGLIALATTLAGCAGGVASSPGSSTPSSAAQSPDTLATGSAPADYTAFCEANRAAAAAKAGTVGEDLAAVQAQSAAIAALLPLQGVSAEVAAGAEVYTASLEENLAILATFPQDSLVSDVGLDPKFTESQALQAALTDPNYQAFIAWAIDTCA